MDCHRRTIYTNITLLSCLLIYKTTNLRQACAVISRQSLHIPSQTIASGRFGAVFMPIMDSQKLIPALGNYNK